MTPFAAGGVASLVGAIIGAGVSGAVSWLRKRQLHARQLERLRTQSKTEFAAEDTARHLFGPKGYADRSFEVPRTHPGGFDDDELRRIRVRAGAVRTFRDDGSAWWRLLGRMDDYIERTAGASHRP